MPPPLPCASPGWPHRRRRRRDRDRAPTVGRRKAVPFRVRPGPRAGGRYSGRGGDRARRTGFPPGARSDVTELVIDSVISKPLRELMDAGGPIGVMVELRSRYEGGISAARLRVTQLLADLAGVREDEIAYNGSYLTVTLPSQTIQELVRYDADAGGSPD